MLKAVAAAVRAGPIASSPSQLLFCPPTTAVGTVLCSRLAGIVEDSEEYKGRLLDPQLLGLPLARYGGRQTVTVLPGDGIGPEMAGHVARVFAHANFPVDFEEVHFDASVIDGVEADHDMDIVLKAIERNGVALKGNIETKYNDPTFRSRNVALRTQLDLFANVLWCRSIRGIPSRHQNVNIVMIRENTEGEYSGIEHETVPGVVESLKIVTRKSIERIAKYAFDYAERFGRKKITAIHKANIMKIGDGLFLHVCQEIAKGYPNIEFNDMIVDNASMQLVSNPQQFDVILMPNLYGNILSNIGCGLIGGPGLVSGINVGSKYAVFETGSRNTGTSIVGKNMANPAAFLNAAKDMLYYLGMESQGRLLKQAIKETLVNKRIHTFDIGGNHTTTDFVDSVIESIDELQT